MIMIATVLRVNPQSLLVRNEENGEEVLVLYRNASTFSAGDRIRITFNGQMTFSIPPQITATGIRRLPPPQGPCCPEPAPSEMRAVVRRVRRDSLLVRRVDDGRLIRVLYRNARELRPGQQVIVRYDTLTIGNPPSVTATDVILLL